MKRLLSLLIIPLVFVVIFAIVDTAPGYTAAENDLTRVWIEFQPGSMGLVREALSRENVQFHYTFERLNAFVVSLPANVLERVKNNPNVIAVEEDVKRYPTSQTVPYGIDSVQARDVWDADRDGNIDPDAPTGAGRLVCIIDSGIQADHEDFAGVDIVGGYPDGWNTDTCGHGTHVAGTIVAANNSLGVVGVTPGTTSLYILQVFGGAECGWTYSSDLVDAANKCAEAGANIISMSLGSPLPFPYEKRAFDDLYDSGILSIAAAGNFGNNWKSFPASYASVVSVAAVDQNNMHADFSQQNDAVEVSAPGVGVLSAVPWYSFNELTVDGVTYMATQIQYAASGTTNGPLVDGGLCDSTGSWTGNVVLCERGEINFYDKVMNVENSGGVAAVIYNNTPGIFSGTLGDGNSSLIQAIGISQSDGQYLVANKLGSTGYVTSIYDPDGENGYEFWDGTSMSTPHVSGVAALIWSADPSKTNVEVREALSSTALDLGDPGRDNLYGFGLVQAYDAWQSLIDKMHISAMDMSYIKIGPFYFIFTKVTVVDENDKPVKDAEVSISIALPGGATATGTGTTRWNGTASIRYRTNETGTFEATITDITHDHFTYDSDANVVSSATLEIP